MLDLSVSRKLLSASSKLARGAVVALPMVTDPDRLMNDSRIKTCGKGCGKGAQHTYTHARTHTHAHLQISTVYGQ